MKTETKHTPGPWEIVDMDGELDIRHSEGDQDHTVATVRESGVDGMTKANARLIAAAPETAAERDRLKAVNAELLEACKAALSVWLENGNQADPIVRKLEAAIKSAEGGN